MALQICTPRATHKSLQVKCFCVEENRAAITTVEKIRNAEILSNPSTFHPLLSAIEAQIC